MNFNDSLLGIAGTVRTFLAVATQATHDLLTSNGVLDATLTHQHQRQLHGLAWMATTGEAVIRASDWGLRLASESALGEAERLLLCVGLGEYLHQLASGIPMGQNEIFRPAELGLHDAMRKMCAEPAVA